MTQAIQNLASQVPSTAPTTESTNTVSVSTSTTSDSKKPKKVKKIIDPDLPKKPFTAYIIFGNEWRKQNSNNFDTKVQFSEISKTWKTLSDKEKKVCEINYNDICASGCYGSTLF